jgi:hypothetical protein
MIQEEGCFWFQDDLFIRNSNTKNYIDLDRWLHYSDKLNPLIELIENNLDIIQNCNMKHQILWSDFYKNCYNAKLYILFFESLSDYYNKNILAKMIIETIINSNIDFRIKEIILKEMMKQNKLFGDILFEYLCQQIGDYFKVFNDEKYFPVFEDNSFIFKDDYMLEVCERLIFFNKKFMEGDRFHNNPYDYLKYIKYFYLLVPDDHVVDLKKIFDEIKINLNTVQNSKNNKHNMLYLRKESAENMTNIMYRNRQYIVERICCSSFSILSDLTKILKMPSYHHSRDLSNKASEYFEKKYNPDKEPQYECNYEKLIKRVIDNNHNKENELVPFVIDEDEVISLVYQDN